MRRARTRAGLGELTPGHSKPGKSSKAALLFLVLPCLGAAIVLLGVLTFSRLGSPGRHGGDAASPAPAIPDGHNQSSKQTATVEPSAEVVPPAVARHSQPTGPRPAPQAAAEPVDEEATTEPVDEVRRLLSEILDCDEPPSIPEEHAQTVLLALVKERSLNPCAKRVLESLLTLDRLDSLSEADLSSLVLAMDYDLSALLALSVAGRERDLATVLQQILVVHCVPADSALPAIRYVLRHSDGSAGVEATLGFCDLVTSNQRSEYQPGILAAVTKIRGADSDLVHVLDRKLRSSNMFFTKQATLQALRTVWRRSDDELLKSQVKLVLEEYVRDAEVLFWHADAPSQVWIDLRVALLAVSEVFPSDEWAAKLQGFLSHEQAGAREIGAEHLGMVLAGMPIDARSPYVDALRAAAYDSSPMVVRQALKSIRRADPEYETTLKNILAAHPGNKHIQRMVEKLLRETR